MSDTRYVLQTGEYPADETFTSLLQFVKAQLGAVIGEQNVDVVLNVDSLRRGWVCSYLNAANNKIGMLNPNHSPIELSAADAASFGIGQCYGNLFYQGPLDEVLAGIINRESLKKPEVEGLKKKLSSLETMPLIQKLKVHKQVKASTIKVDMFAKNASLTVKDGAVSIALPHRPFEAAYRPEEAIIESVLADYTEHFPGFTDFVDMLLHARFAPDRRRAFVWLHANSDWGKGLLVAVFKNLGLLFDLPVKALERVIAGETVGLSPADILRCWILHVDEFKSASSELKQLNTSMEVTAKYELATTVDLFVKLFCSAEDVRSLVGGGIEDQFNKRFAYVHPKEACLDDRPVFKRFGKQVYLDALTAHVADTLNQGVEKLQRMGREAAAMKADQVVDDYQQQRMLSATFGSMQHEMREIARRIRVLLRRYYQLPPGGRPSGPEIAISQPLFNVIHDRARLGYVKQGKDYKAAIQLPDAPDFITGYLAEGHSKSTAAKFSYKAAAISALAHMANNAGGYTGKCQMYRQDSADRYVPSDRQRGLVVLVHSNDDDLAGDLP